MFFFGEKVISTFSGQKTWLLQRIFKKEGVLVYEHTQLSAYATPQEIDTIRKVGESLFVQDKYVDVEKNLLDIAKETEAKRKHYSKQALKKTSNSALLALYQELFNLMKRFLYSYRYTEPHYLDLLEKKVDQFLDKQEKNKEKKGRIMGSATIHLN